MDALDEHVSGALNASGNRKRVEHNEAVGRLVQSLVAYSVGMVMSFYCALTLEHGWIFDVPGFLYLALIGWELFHFASRRGLLCRIGVHKWERTDTPRYWRRRCVKCSNYQRFVWMGDGTGGGYWTDIRIHA